MLIMYVDTYEDFVNYFNDIRSDRRHDNDNISVLFETIKTLIINQENPSYSYNSDLLLFYMRLGIELNCDVTFVNNILYKRSKYFDDVLFKKIKLSSESYIKYNMRHTNKNMDLLITLLVSKKRSDIVISIIHHMLKNKLHDFSGDNLSMRDDKISYNSIYNNDLLVFIKKITLLSLQDQSCTNYIIDRNTELSDIIIGDVKYDDYYEEVNNDAYNFITNIIDYLRDSVGYNLFDLAISYDPKMDKRIKTIKRQLSECSFLDYINITSGYLNILSNNIVFILVGYQNFRLVDKLITQYGRDFVLKNNIKEKLTEYFGDNIRGIKYILERLNYDINSADIKRILYRDSTLTEPGLLNMKIEFGFDIGDEDIRKIMMIYRNCSNFCEIDNKLLNFIGNKASTLRLKDSLKNTTCKFNVGLKKKKKRIINRIVK